MEIFSGDSLLSPPNLKKWILRDISSLISSLHTLALYPNCSLDNFLSLPLVHVQRTPFHDFFPLFIMFYCLTEASFASCVSALWDFLPFALSSVKKRDPFTLNWLESHERWDEDRMWVRRGEIRFSVKAEKGKGREHDFIITTALHSSKHTLHYHYSAVLH